MNSAFNLATNTATSPKYFSLIFLKMKNDVPKKIAVRKEPATQTKIANIAWSTVIGAISFPRVSMIREYKVKVYFLKFVVFL